MGETRLATRLTWFESALARTREAIAECEQTRSSVVRDGVIQRFEFTAELAWKTCREALMEDGFVGIDSPKAVMRQAFASGLIDDEDGWLNLLTARNLTSHMYSEEQAEAVYRQVAERYVALFESLLEKLKN